MVLETAGGWVPMERAEKETEFQVYIYILIE